MTVKSIYFDGNTVECVYFDDMMGFHTLQVPNHCVEMVPAIDPTVVPVKVPKVPKENERKK